MQVDASRSGRARGRGPKTTAGKARVALKGADARRAKTAADVPRTLATKTENLTANPGLDPIWKAQVIAQLTRVELRAIALDDLPARVEAIETALKFRKDQTKLEKP